ncbi:phage baseplate assembly protein V [Paraburkholderia xenovorans]|uniref:phage baseplate assembly protein V n=1 Tax=Paraburkholderia xenovorans TaxID=36873 RepID=UPI0038BAD971
MRPVPLIVLRTGEPALPLTVLKPLWVETHHKVNGIPTARLVLSVPGDALTMLSSCDDMVRCKPGRTAVITLLESGVESCIFRGVIVQQSLRLRRSCVELTLILRHSLQRLVNTHRSQIFEVQNDAAIIGSLFLEQAIPLLGVTGMELVHEQLVQFRCSDWKFIRYRLNANGVWLFPSPDGVTLTRPRLSAIADHTLHQHALLVEDDVLIEESDWSFSKQYQTDKLTVAAWDDETQINDVAIAAATPLGTGAFDSAGGTTLNVTTWEFNYSTPLGIEQTATLASSLLMNLQSSGAQGEFVVNGAVTYELGQTLAVADFGQSFDGMGIITGVRQRIHMEEGWRTTLSLGTDDVLADMQTIPRVSGLHIGVAETFSEDMTGMNRLRVRLPVLGEVDNVLWARFASPYASNLSGFCFYPEPGDELVIGFFDEDPSYPVILGAMHSLINRAPVEPSLENYNKALVINRHGQQLQLAFDAMEPSVQLATPGNELTLQSGITLQSEESVLIKASSISIEGEEAALSGKSMVNITGAKIDLSQ